jgi:hypothetical protein
MSEKFSFEDITRPTELKPAASGRVDQISRNVENLKGLKSAALGKADSKGAAKIAHQIAVLERQQQQIVSNTPGLRRNRPSRG